MNNILKLGTLACLVLVAGCDKKASGQVAAVVNGEEITLQELNAELQGVPTPSGANAKALQQAALQRIVERRLLAQEARKDGVDKTPDYLIRSRQLEDGLLVQLLGRNAERGAEVPSTKEVDNYIKANPALFENRTVYALDRIQFPMPANVQQLKTLEDAHSMDAVQAKLRELGIQFKRDAGRMDSAQLGQELSNRIAALPPGEPFVLPEGGAVTVAVITGTSKQPISPEQARPLAVQVMRNNQVRSTLQQRLKAAQTAAKIEYQPGFAPPPRTQPSANSASAKR